MGDGNLSYPRPDHVPVHTVCGASNDGTLSTGPRKYASNDMSNSIPDGYWCPTLGMQKEAVQVAAMAIRFALEVCDEEHGRK